MFTQLLDANSNKKNVLDEKSKTKHKYIWECWSFANLPFLFTCQYKKGLSIEVVHLNASLIRSSIDLI